MMAASFDPAIRNRMTTNGYIKFHRSILANSLYVDRERFCKRAAWADILLNVNHAPMEVLIGSQLITCEAGQCLYSLDTWAQRWRWENKMQVRRFFDLLERMEMIRTENVVKTLRLTVCKWESYQGNGYASVTHLLRNGYGLVTDLLPIEEDKEYKEEKEGIVEAEETPAKPDQWRHAVMLDDAFLETVKMRFKYTDADIGQRLEQFHADKKGLELLTHKTYSEYRSNFFYWLQKQPTNNNDKNVKNANGRNHQYLIHPDDARAIAADLAAEFGK